MWITWNWIEASLSEYSLLAPVTVHAWKTFQERKVCWWSQLFHRSHLEHTIATQTWIDQLANNVTCESVQQQRFFNTMSCSLEWPSVLLATLYHFDPLQRSLLSQEQPDSTPVYSDSSSSKLQQGSNWVSGLDQIILFLFNSNHFQTSYLSALLGLTNSNSLL